MSEYWVSLPKKFCEFCKCWYQDNKASIEFHERGFRHQANVKKRLNEMRRNGAKKETEQEKYKLEMMKIESAAMKSFQSDINSNPQLASELSRTSSLINKLPTVEKESSQKIAVNNRFGESYGTEDIESKTLVRGREKALDTIAKKFEKKSKWLEAKTAEGQIYYWHKETFETKWKAPKSGYLSLEEQKHLGTTDIPTFAPSTSSDARYDPYGRWHTVQEAQPYNNQMIDLQVPNQELPAIEVPEIKPIEEKQVDFKEKTVESLDKKASAGNISFKKRKNNNEIKRSIRQRTDED